MILKIFFSWQVETNLQGFNNKDFLKECIGSAIKQIENKGTLKGIHFELIEGLFTYFVYKLGITLIYHNCIS